MKPSNTRTLRNRGRKSIGVSIKRSFLMTPDIDNAISRFTASDPTYPTFSQAVRTLLIKGLEQYGIRL